jgi:folate-dependent tRNA-U54 methylase TrmFO/GidA
MRPEYRKRVYAYVNTLKVADPVDVPMIKEQFSEWYDALTEKERDEIRPFWDKRLGEAKQIIGKIEKMLAELESLQKEDTQRNVKRISV